MFGASRGAYTGAVTDRAGLLAAADGGTLFLDELSELSIAAQAKLLRFVQEGTYRRLGENRLRRIRARIVAATNRSVEELLESRRLKADLFFRLNGYRLHLPPLRSRPFEIADLASKFARSEGLHGVSTEAMTLLRRYGWPGNVRELEMCVRSAAASCAPGGMLEADAIRYRWLERGVTDIKAATLRAGRTDVERQMLERALEENGGNVTAASRALGISRQAFYKARRRVGLA